MSPTTVSSPPPRSCRAPARSAVTLATLVVAALAAITQTACIEPRDGGLPVDLAAGLLAPAPAPAPAAVAAAGRCAALHQADRLDARLALDYQQVRALPAGGRLSQRHGADVHGSLPLMQRDEAGAVWSGPVQEGVLALDDRLDGVSGQRARQLAGRGVPRRGAALAGSVVTVRVVFADCSLHYAARLALAATGSQAGQGSQRTALPLQELGRLSLSQPDATPVPAADGRPVLSGEREVPAQGRLLDSGYRPGGLAASWGDGGGAAIGTARLRWRFTPLREAEA